MPAPLKQTVYVTVVGRSSSGKSAVMQLFADVLMKASIETEINWGTDGEPLNPEPDFIKRRLNAVAHRSRVVLSEHATRRIGTKEEHFDDILVQVDYDKDKGYGVRLKILGVPLESWFGTFHASKERARSIAARLSAELDVNVDDKIPREYDWVQPR